TRYGSALALRIRVAGAPPCPISRFSQSAPPLDTVSLADRQVPRVRPHPRRRSNVPPGSAAARSLQCRKSSPESGDARPTPCRTPPRLLRNLFLAGDSPLPLNVPPPGLARLALRFPAALCPRLRPLLQARCNRIRPALAALRNSYHPASLPSRIRALSSSPSP